VAGAGANIISGKEIAKDVRFDAALRVERMKKHGIEPRLETVLVGDDPASHSYIKGKRKAAEETGIAGETTLLKSDTSEEDLLAIIRRLNEDPKIHGILTQLPLPTQISEAKVIDAISPMKDVDCFHPENVGLLSIGRPRFRPCTPAGVVELLMRSGNDPAGKDVVIVGRSNIVGRPLSIMLAQKAAGGNATVTVCHTKTHDLATHTLRADIVIAAAGAPKAITADMVSEGVVVVDVGVNRIDDPSAKGGSRLVGDVDFEAVARKARAITPVPGGVGPMTIAMLMQNTVRAAEMQAGAASPDAE
jgi:methylenetetrahydrofolate dehydrogenase (NADP+)/methenyltetrahydrofolate cyclohydrolase